MNEYHRDPKFIVRQTLPQDFDGIQSLCLRVYPFIAPWGDKQLQSHQDVFPEGQIVVEERATGRIVGMSASLIVYWENYDIEDGWRDFTDHGFFRNHDPENGHTLYGAEIMVDPACRGLGLGKLIYAARKQIVRDHGLLRMRAGARLQGYSQYAEALSPEQYLLQIVRGEVFDPTISFQIKRGFHVMALVKGYLPNDPETLGWAVVIEWLNEERAGDGDYAMEMARYDRIFGPLGENGRVLYESVCARSGKSCNPLLQRSVSAKSAPGSRS
jgi:ribosomal protein S18 acetylase RimI-like enzyme